MTGDASKFRSLEYFKGGNVVFGDNNKGRIIGSGTVGKDNATTVENVLLVEGLKQNLLSISQLCDRGSYDDEEEIVKEKEPEEEKTQEQTELPKEWRTLKNHPIDNVIGDITQGVSTQAPNPNSFPSPIFSNFIRNFSNFFHFLTKFHQFQRGKLSRCKNASSRQESAAEEGEKPWRREGSKYIHIQTGLAFNTGASAERFHNIFLTKEIVSPKIVNKDLFKSATYAPNLTRDTQVPVKKTCFITEAKFSRIVYREEGDAALNLDLIVADEEESQNETQAESSRAGGSRATEHVTRQRRTRPREEAPEPSWVKRIFDTLTCIRDDVRELNERMTRFEHSRSYRGPRHSFSRGARPANSL
ncbi:unnamed protein product [Cuscuta campestris]|uniref:Retrovirus-related Pol polyprotein from transposon TNT 1-94-like beta-barrel domain-containing protein n=1 Tax=Cuscuta campestris TaxID=132261 RepID=A0A484LSB5_9ASTE|nr:unnamed protein product [Cuscuta campestris]